MGTQFTPQEGSTTSITIIFHHDEFYIRHRTTKDKTLFLTLKVLLKCLIKVQSNIQKHKRGSEKIII